MFIIIHYIRILREIKDHPIEKQEQQGGKNNEMEVPGIMQFFGKGQTWGKGRVCYLPFQFGGKKDHKNGKYRNKQWMKSKGKKVFAFQQKQKCSCQSAAGAGKSCKNAENTKLKFAGKKGIYPQDGKNKKKDTRKWDDFLFTYCLKIRFIRQVH